MLDKKLELTGKNVIERLSQHMLADVFPFVLDIKRSQGNYLFDAVSERLLLDCFNFIASNPLGYNHPKLDDKEFEEKLLRVSKLKVSNSDLYSVEMGQFVETFTQIAMPKEMKYLFFVEGGALAIENALKTAFDWKVRLNFARGIKEELGTKILHFKEAFHGRSGYTMSLTNTDPVKIKYYPKFDWPRVSNPKIKFPLEQNIESVKAAEIQSIQEIEDAFSKHHGDIAAIIIEAIQGEGGDNHFRSEFHQSLRRLADKHEAMLIYDEVQAGMGLTGKMWAYQHYGVTPDIVAFGKKSQVCGIMVGPRVDLAKDNVFVEPSRINSTWGGNLTDMVRCQRYLEVIEEDALLENAVNVGNYLLENLIKLQSKYPDLISNARGKGLMCSLDLPSPEIRKKFVADVLELGAIILTCGQKSLRFRPSLTFSRKNVDELIDILEKAIARI